ncbi:fatty acid desaturase family protein [Oligoflexus tunisiensis]|uniref:fatty acid desaturase family protein n=1 Tax=Oligoflexus tunisiensis TaxID=708132 RepID=UPI00114CD558|nr:acyl-CoA desaturase [Oligoflexus tunisiensis]
MQSIAKPGMDPRRSHALWQSMLSQVVEEELHAPATKVLLWKIPLLTLLGSVSLGWAWLGTSPWQVAAACCILAFVLAQFAFLGHDAGHGSLGRSRFVHTALGQFCMTVVTGLAFAEWYARHRTHHQFCQHEPKDPDMDVDLVVSLTEDSLRRKNALGRFLTRCQGISVWFLSLFFAHSQRHLSQWGVLREPRKFALDLAVLGLHFSLWWALPLIAFDITFGRVLLAYTLPLFILGPYLAAIFWVNHVGMPLIENPDAFSFLEHQAVTSRTVVNPGSMDWFFGGLNFQIEHHLYPQIPSFRLRRVQRIVESAFEAEQIPYNRVSFAEAVRSIAAHFSHIAKR